MRRPASALLHVNIVAQSSYDVGWASAHLVGRSDESDEHIDVATNEHGKPSCGCLVGRSNDCESARRGHCGLRRELRINPPFTPCVLMEHGDDEIVVVSSTGY